MNSSLTRERREDRIREIAAVFRVSKLFRSRPRPREDLKPRISENLTALIEGGLLAAGGLISSGLVRAALDALDWRVSESTVATVLWHLAQNQLLEYDGLYYKVPARPGAGGGRLDLGEAIKEFVRAEKDLAVFNLFTAAGRGPIEAEAAGVPKKIQELAARALGSAAERNYLQRIRISAKNEKDTENQPVLVHRIFAVEYFFWKADCCAAVLDEFRGQRQAAMRRLPYAFRPGNRKKWKTPPFAPVFRAAFREQNPDSMLFTGGHGLRTLAPSPDFEPAGLAGYGIVPEKTTGGAADLVLTCVCRAGAEKILAHIMVLSAAPELEIQMQPPSLRVSRKPS